ncbi:unnamed protein product [Acanthoscelides obtectus]|uniref:Zinc finger PHD-type domain-containing protein n=1 Tax=Acanthoscelides obtectus TaxID=200917 RepID=A0A9P0JGF9_ACAOB|nr:unnamed protein product [Acanthoscelides obtectus]CAK1649996.1 hypothetical protein AOBTE_LOCUS16532 [Acanthoscelides obtectus]
MQAKALVKRKVFPEITEKEKSDDESDKQAFVPDDEDMDVDEIGQSVCDDKDAVCLFCDERFSENQIGELWVRCIMCNLWAHEQCSGAEKDDYVCDFCR